ncbi:MAG: hypothetical protein J4G16_04210 [Acidobacteria bacterium]|nr:hypothetical protein [Acidobacteriota bacterium]
MSGLRSRRRSWPALIGLLAAVVPASAAGQGRLVESVEVRCPSVLGIGVETDLVFCDVLAQQDPALGVIVVLPPRRGEATLTFNLHNRHTYSEDDVRRGRAYARYLAEVAVASPAGDVLGRRYVLNEFRTAEDLFDRVAGGAGPEGIKAIAPTGMERVSVTIPGNLNQVVIVGQTLEVTLVDGNLERTWSPGRPVAVISEVQLEYASR